ENLICESVHIEELAPNRLSVFHRQADISVLYRNHCVRIEKGLRELLKCGTRGRLGRSATSVGTSAPSDIAAARRSADHAQVRSERRARPVDPVTCLTVPLAAFKDRFPAISVARREVYVGRCLRA